MSGCLLGAGALREVPASPLHHNSRLDSDCAFELSRTRFDGETDLPPI
jgi:hypothetical protein